MDCSMLSLIVRLQHNNARQRSIVRLTNPPMNVLTLMPLLTEPAYTSNGFRGAIRSSHSLGLLVNPAQTARVTRSASIMPVYFQPLIRRARGDHAVLSRSFLNLS